MLTQSVCAHTPTSIPGTAATWADYDSDGDVDLLITGNFVGAVDIEGKSDIWSNDGTCTLPEAINALAGCWCSGLR